MKSLLKLFRARRVLRQWSRPRSAIVIEPNPHSIRGVFERSDVGATGGRPRADAVGPYTSWRWPTSTWLQKRRAQTRTVQTLRYAPSATQGERSGDGLNAGEAD